MNQNPLLQRQDYNFQDRDPLRETHRVPGENIMDVNRGYNRSPILITGTNHA